MAKIILPQAQLSQAPDSQKLQSQADLIIKILGQNPYAQAIDQIGPKIEDALALRAKRRKDAQKIAEYAALTGQSIPPDKSSLDIEEYNKGLEYNLAQKKLNDSGKQKPYTGPTVQKDGKNYGVLYDDLTGDFKLKELPSPISGRFQASTRGAVQQTTLADSSDSTPLLFDRDAKQYIRSTDGLPSIGKPVPFKANSEAIQNVSRSAVLMPKINMLFDSLAKKNDLTARLSVAPVISPIFYPEINQLKNEVKQIGFSFGGKNFTGTEENIIVNALIPTEYDNDASREAKRQALLGYTTGQIDLLQAANLLGPAGEPIKKLIEKVGNSKNTLSIPTTPKDSVDIGGGFSYKVKSK